MRSDEVVLYEQGDHERVRAIAEARQSAEVRYLAELLRLGPTPLIATAELCRLVVQVGDTLLPVIVNEGQESLSYLVSQEVHYIRYMQEELAKIRGDLTARWVSLAISAMGRLALPLGFNRCVSMNNWLLTTSQTVSLDSSQLRALASVLARRFPTLPIVLRGIDLRPAGVREAFEEAGYGLIIHRPVFEITKESATAKWSLRHQNNRERKMLRRGPLKITVGEPLAPGEEVRIAELNRQLYVEKHSRYNSRFTPLYFRTILDTGLERLITARLDGELVGFSTVRDDRERLVAALVGYDTRFDQREVPIYRMLVAAAINVARDEDKICFLSTGNANFKKARGGVEWFEYEAIYQRHLRPHRRLPWWMFRTAFDRASSSLDTGQI